MKKQKYGMFVFVDKEGRKQFRKPNPRQRKLILIYYLRRRSGRVISVSSIAKAFHISERTVQKLLKELEEEKIIRREPVYYENGFQKANKIVYIGDKKRLKGNEPSIDKVFEDGNPMKLRDFSWEGYWDFVDEPKLFFNYHEIFGEDGPNDYLNKQSRKLNRKSEEALDEDNCLFDDEDDFF